MNTEALPLERCCICDEATGRGGTGDDSLYASDGEGPFCVDCHDAYESGRRSCDAEVQKLVDALRPFADAAHAYYDSASDKAPARYPHGLTIGDYRRAAAALVSTQGKQQ